MPGKGTAHVSGLHDDEIKDDPLAEAVVMNYSDPHPGLADVPPANWAASGRRSKPSALFNADGAKVEQRWAPARMAPVCPTSSSCPRGVKFDNNAHPAVQLWRLRGLAAGARYYASWGAGWAGARGGAMVIANIPWRRRVRAKWHRAAILKNKQKSYDDFIAVAEQLIRTNSPRPAASASWVAPTAACWWAPPWFSVLTCSMPWSAVPLLDMKRFHLLLAGASWMAEYGNPDKTEDWASLSKISPYHNVFRTSATPRLLPDQHP